MPASETRYDFGRNWQSFLAQVTGGAISNAEIDLRRLVGELEGDILAEPSQTGGQYDVVYSWGVLHHTGDMWRAIENASRFVKANARFVIALYIKTPLCPVWKAEKFLYSRYPLLRPAIRYPYAMIVLAGHALLGRLPARVLRDYKEKRRLSFMHDIDDWLGGYPYQSASHSEVVDFAGQLGFTLSDYYNTETPSPYKWLFGTGCSEWVFTRA